MAGVYISYPFCAQKCTFCNFASGVSSTEVRARYEQRLLREIQKHKWLWVPETLYLGGGTPSLMPREFLRDLVSTIPRENLSEVTLECAPGSLSSGSAEFWFACGVNRVSLGVQSFVTSELRQTGRRHTAETVESDIARLRQAGIEDINIDLIAGLPAQTRESWRTSLDWIEGLAPPHVSIYIFEVDEDSRLGKEVLLNGQRYGAAAVPDDDLTAELYETAVDRLARFGLSRYEISNFARPGYESRHNLKYWQLEPYAGFGLDAHSFDGERRSSNPDTLPAYLAADRIQSTASNRTEERFFVGLRLSRGVEPTPEEWSRFSQPIHKWIDQGMLERAGSSLRLSHRGVLLSNEVLQDFVDA